MTRELDVAVARLHREFPGLPHDVVTSLLGDCYQLVVEASGEPQVRRAEELARLRLQVRTLPR